MPKQSLKPAPGAKFRLTEPTLVIRMEPWHRGFQENLRDFFRSADAEETTSAPGTFWPDVFVASYLPWRRFMESVVAHTAAVAMLWGVTQLWQERPQVIAAPVFHKDDVVYYQPDDYLPPLDTGGAKQKIQQAADPAFAPQPIISVPPEADNRKQTIVSPPNVKLEHDVPVPNMVAWDHAAPTVPMAATHSVSKLPDVQPAVVAPAPEIKPQLRAVPQSLDAAVAPAPDMQATNSRSAFQTPEASVIAPPPSIENANTRKLGDINIGHANVVAPAPSLPLAEQRASLRIAQTEKNGGAAVVPPPPSVGQAGSAGGGRVIALNVQPIAVREPDAPAGNRRGTFAATPEGRPGASGTPGGSGSSTSSGAGDAKKANGLPSGLFVGDSKSANVAPVSGSGQGDHAAQVNPSLIAKATPPPISTQRNSGSNISAPTSEIERRVFGDNRVYAMTLNTPNLNSAGGSWVMHFADFDQSKPGELAAPVAIREVDPGYPIELMKRNVQGTVMLSAVIFPDGTVGGVHVLRGIDDTLDQYASTALSKWKFQPATKNGSPVAVQTVVVIPFHPMRAKGF